MARNIVPKSVDQKWKAKIEEASYHVDALTLMIKALEEKPKGNAEILRTLNYALWVLRENHQNLVDVYQAVNK